jgi:hypothetical protein
MKTIHQETTESHAEVAEIIQTSANQFSEANNSIKNDLQKMLNENKDLKN